MQPLQLKLRQPNTKDLEFEKQHYLRLSEEAQDLELRKRYFAVGFALQQLLEFTTAREQDQALSKETPLQSE